MTMRHVGDTFAAPFEISIDYDSGDREWESQPYAVRIVDDARQIVLVTHFRKHNMIALHRMLTDELAQVAVGRPLPRRR